MPQMNGEETVWIRAHRRLGYEGTGVFFPLYVYDELSSKTSVALDDGVNNNVIWISRGKTSDDEMQAPVPPGFLDGLLRKVEEERRSRRTMYLSKEEEKVVRRLWGEWMLVGR